MARKAISKLDDVDFKLMDKDGVVDLLSKHSSISDSLKGKIKEINEKVEEEVKQSSSNEIYLNYISDFNCIGIENNEVGIFVKKDEGGDIFDSDWQEYLLFLEEEQKLKEDNISEEERRRIFRSREERAERRSERKNKKQMERFYSQNKRSLNRLERRRELRTGREKGRLKNIVVNKYSDIKESAFGFFKSTREDIRTKIHESKFDRQSIRQLRRDVKEERKELKILLNQGKGIVYNGEGRKIGEKDIQYKNDLGKTIVEEFYLPVYRMINSAKEDNVDISVIRAYVSYEEQLETRRLYAPDDKKRNNQWLVNNTSDNFLREDDTIIVQPPGYGYHIFGTAFDLNATDMKVYSWLIENAHNYGFYRTIENEIWHWEYKPWLYRLGGKRNPGKSRFEGESEGGWLNEIWEKLYTKINDYEDPIGPKFLPNNNDSWLGKENLAKIEEIDNSNEIIIDDEDEG